MVKFSDIVSDDCADVTAVFTAAGDDDCSGATADCSGATADFEDSAVFLEECADVFATNFTGASSTAAADCSDAFTNFDADADAEAKAFFVFVDVAAAVDCPDAAEFLAVKSADATAGFTAMTVMV